MWERVLTEDIGWAVGTARRVGELCLDIFVGMRLGGRKVSPEKGRRKQGKTELKEDGKDEIKAGGQGRTGELEKEEEVDGRGGGDQKSKKCDIKKTHFYAV